MTDRRRSVALTEVEMVQNPALGAIVLWTYARAYQDTVSRKPTPFLPLFLVLPLCLHRPTLELAIHTNPSSGLGKFCEKISERREELFAIHERALLLRELTISSLAFGQYSELFQITYHDASLIAVDAKHPLIPERILPLMKGAKRIGTWFRSVDTVEIFKALKVDA